MGVARLGKFHTEYRSAARCACAEPRLQGYNTFRIIVDAFFFNGEQVQLEHNVTLAKCERTRELGDRLATKDPDQLRVRSLTMIEVTLVCVDEAVRKWCTLAPDRRMCVAPSSICLLSSLEVTDSPTSTRLLLKKVGSRPSASAATRLIVTRLSSTTIDRNDYPARSSDVSREWLTSICIVRHQKLGVLRTCYRPCHHHYLNPTSSSLHQSIEPTQVQWVFALLTVPLAGFGTLHPSRSHLHILTV